MKLPVLRACAALAGSLVGIAGWLLTELARTGSLERIVGDPRVQLPVTLGPPLVAFLLALLLTTLRPAIGSLAVTLLVLLVSAASGGAIMFTIGMLAAGPAGEAPHGLLTWLAAIAFMAIFGALRVGPLAFLAGWLVYFLLDRAAIRRCSAPGTPPGPAPAAPASP